MDRRRIHIMDLCARTGLVDINSDQSEGSLMNLPIGPSEDAFHEAHVRIHKRERSNFASCRVSLRYLPAYVGEPVESIEVGDR